MEPEKRPAHRPRVYSGTGAPKLTLRLPSEALSRVMERGGAAWARQVIMEALEQPIPAQAEVEDPGDSPR